MFMRTSGHGEEPWSSRADVTERLYQTVCYRQLGHVPVCSSVARGCHRQVEPSPYSGDYCRLCVSSSPSCSCGLYPTFNIYLVRYGPLYNAKQQMFSSTIEVITFTVACNHAGCCTIAARMLPYVLQQFVSLKLGFMRHLPQATSPITSPRSSIATSLCPFQHLKYYSIHMYSSVVFSAAVAHVLGGFFLSPTAVTIHHKTCAVHS